jgi:hypothetical protein
MDSILSKFDQIGGQIRAAFSWPAGVNSVPDLGFRPVHVAKMQHILPHCANRPKFGGV